MDYMSLIYKNIRMEGFVVYRWLNEWMDGLHQMRDWIAEVMITRNFHKEYLSTDCN